jgi:hypothetical protein
MLSGSPASQKALTDLSLGSYARQPRPPVAAVSFIFSTVSPEFSPVPGTRPRYRRASTGVEPPGRAVPVDQLGPVIERVRIGQRVHRLDLAFRSGGQMSPGLLQMSAQTLLSEHIHGQCHPEFARYASFNALYRGSFWWIRTCGLNLTMGSAGAALHHPPGSAWKPDGRGARSGRRRRCTGVPPRPGLRTSPAGRWRSVRTSGLSPAYVYPFSCPGSFFSNTGSTLMNLPSAGS